MTTDDPKINNQTVAGSTILTIEPGDIEQNKTMAGLAYIIFFLPLLACPDSKFGRYHANQGLLLLLLGFAGSIVLSMIPIIGWILLPIFALGMLVLAILGLVNGFGGKVKELPLIGKFRLLK
ncbi:MAG: hypothetical protein PHO25_04060 [Syntrophomonadaceae bacterium]|nr:hypothetical protein [Syntrophomonadaceae bacterium]